MCQMGSFLFHLARLLPVIFRICATVHQNVLVGGFCSTWHAFRQPKHIRNAGHAQMSGTPRSRLLCPPKQIVGIAVQHLIAHFAETELLDGIHCPCVKPYDFRLCILTDTQ